MKRGSPAMIMPCKTLSVFVCSRLLPRTCMCIDTGGISLHICALMPLNALNILLYTMCMFCFLLSLNWRLSFLMPMTSRQSHSNPQTLDNKLFKSFPILEEKLFMLSFFLLALSISLLFFIFHSCLLIR